MLYNSNKYLQHAQYCCKYLLIESGNACRALCIIQKDKIASDREWVQRVKEME